ncbi:MAG: phosphoglucosamine mutase [Candidatus Cloacimonadales bacterium]|nr:phosphoglucosamine mutase [Candidatus Cloacimonadota bacterium]MDD3501515.1 phosphoglucosamine mutase [Candidatus Cloacimonadota bacterium]MDX9976483.1 phosphoglucosamine mutase [Candidatus Cloacimonadales bacterium]
MSKLMMSVSGVRGIFGKGMDPQLIFKISAHLANYLRNKNQSDNPYIIIGRDSRTTGEALFHAAASGIMSVGVNVQYLGIATTPTVLLAVEQAQGKAIGGICITASHNPAEWNALKLVDQNGMFLFPEFAKEFYTLIDNPIPYTSWDKIGKLSTYDKANEDHINKVLEIPYIGLDQIRSKHFRVVLDSVNGAGCVISKKMLTELGCEVIEINGEPTGIFAHNPEPLNKNLAQLEDAVKQHNADIGFATDPDGDRLAIVSEKGVCIGEEFSLLLAEKFVLSKVKGDIVTNLSSSMASDDIAQEFGVSVIRTAIGEINVGKKMKEIKSPIGGEGNGGIICPDVHYTRDAIAGMALILAFMAEELKPISEIVMSIPHYFIAKEKLDLLPEQLDKVMEHAYTIYPDTDKNTTDGIKYIFDKKWVHIRKSGTEPIIRVYAEAKTQDDADQLCDKTIKKLMEI